jgi:hypothetical protein
MFIECMRFFFYGGSSGWLGFVICWGGWNNGYVPFAGSRGQGVERVVLPSDMKEAGRQQLFFFREWVDESLGSSTRMGRV